MRDRISEKAAHAEALGKPQPFPLTGDGKNTATIYDRAAGRLLYKGTRLGGTTADARYRDWLAARDRNAGGER